MKKLRWQLLVVVLALGAIGILLYTQQPNLIPGGGDAPVKPTTGGVYTEALIGAPARLNPLLDAYNPVDRDVDRLLFSGLVRFDDRGLPQGDLAEAWGVSQDGTVYNFSLRAKAVWHDGKPITSDDILFTVDLLRSEQLPTPADLRTFWKQVEVQALDDRTVQFRLPEPFAPFLDYLTFGVLPKHLLSNVAPDALVANAFNMKPVGSGPYRFDRAIVENGQIKAVVLHLFSNYYAQPPFIEQVIFRYFPSAKLALAAYQQNDVMGISQIDATILDQALKTPNLNVYTSRLPRLSLLYLNLKNPDLPFFQDKDVRRALLTGLNRQRIIDRVLHGQAFQADGPILPGTWAYLDGLERLDYDPDKAIAMLKAAGYTVPAGGGSVRAKDKVEMAFELAYPDSAPFTDIAQYVQEDWQRLGVKVDLKAVPYDKLVSDYLTPRTYQAALVELNLSRSPDPDPYPFWHQAQATDGQNYAQWDDRPASEYLEQARVQVDLTERLKRYRNFQARFVAEMPALPLYFPVYSYGVDSQVQGVRTGPLFEPADRFDTISQWFLMAKRATPAPLKLATDLPAATAPVVTPIP